MGTRKDRVKLNVGGKIFETTATTLAGAGRNSLFGAMFDENWNQHPDGTITEHFIDRNPDYFGVLLDLLRTGELYIPPEIDKKPLYREAEYYGILDCLRSDKWVPFDGNRARLAESVTGGWSATDGYFPLAIQANSSGQCSVALGGVAHVYASPSGWCCVAQDSVVRVYDWMLEERPIIHTQRNKVNHICWVDNANIVISTSGKLASGGMCLFNASTGESRYKFKVTDGHTAGALAVSPDSKLFSSCNITDNEHGIGVWDQNTGKQINFLDSPPNRSCKTAIRLQWLRDTNCLMVVSVDDICLFDFRENNMVWSWAMARENNHVFSGITDSITDSMAIEESRSICVLHKNDGMGFMDLRSTNGSVNWRHYARLDKTSRFENFAIHEKLAFHNGQLFASTEDSIFVHSGSDWLLTSQIKQSGSICDFSVGGDHLFALRKAENVIDVWETPRLNQYPSLI